MRPTILVLGLTFAGAAHAMEPQTVHMVRVEADAARINDADVATWDAEAWIGGDTNRLWLKSEGDIEDGDAASAEVQALWSRNIADFWDLQAGVRVDVEPSTTTYLVLGVQGLAPYRFETEATGFVSEKGDVSARLRQSLDLHVTQLLIAEPHVELEVFGQDLQDRRIGAGLADVEAGVQFRYEITRKFAPYLDLIWERALGKTATLARATGDEVETGSVRAGLRFWF